MLRSLSRESELENLERSESEISERSELDILPLTPQPWRVRVTLVGN